MKRCPEYKESGVEWIGEIPKHWEVQRNKRIFNEKDDRSGTGKEELLTVSHITGVSPRAEKKNVGMFLAETLVGYKHCSVGNLVINTMWAWMGALGISAFDGIVSPSYNVYELKGSEYLPRYYDYLYRTPNHVNEIIRWSKGIWTSRWRLYPDAFFSMFTIIPPFREQTQIANFLDGKTAQIDELIRIKERRIELLQEQRTTLINQAVTKGLDPNVAMKPSGVEWIGEIPSNWRSSRLKFHLAENSGGVWGEDDEFGNGTYVIRSTEIMIDGRWNLQNVIRRKLSKEEGERLLLRKGDLIVTKSSGSQDHIGKTGLVDEIVEAMDVCYSNFVQKLRPQSHINSKFLHYFMNCSLAREQYKYQSETTTGLANLNAQSINELFISVPSEQEQTQIVDCLDRKTQQIDELIAAEQRKIELLKEYRQSLISEAVTGRIDVRNAQIV